MVNYITKVMWSGKVLYLDNLKKTPCIYNLYAYYIIV